MGRPMACDGPSAGALASAGCKSSYTRTAYDDVSTLLTWWAIKHDILEVLIKVYR